MTGSPSAAPSIDALPESVQQQLGEILDRYLTAAEQGSPISPEELVAQHPEYGALLRDYLNGLRLFHDAATNLREPSAEPVSLTGDQIGPGTTIGDFHLQREIGRGGMGVVYEARQLSLDRRVALKVLLFDGSQNAKQRARFKNEAQAAASIDHPNIVPVYAVGEENGVHYYAMQLIEGRSLNDLLADQRIGPVSPSAPTIELSTASTLGDHQPAGGQESRAPQDEPVGPLAADCDARDLARWGAEAAAALHSAHQLGVVHRDVKPSNLLVDEHGKLWVTDFGLARCRHNTGLTQTGAIVGTLRYMSPEQTRGGAIDHRADVYSLGVTLYELATLHHPSGDGSDIELLLAPQRRVLPINHWDRRLPKDFQTIVMKAIADHPDDRYATAQDFADDLQRFLDGKPIQASPPTVLSRLARWSRRRQRSLLAAAALLLAAFALQTAVMLKFNSLAKQNRIAFETSQRNLAYALDIIDGNSDLFDQLAAIPGAEGVSYQLLDKSLDLYDRLEEQSADVPSLNSEWARAHGRKADLYERGRQFDEAAAQHAAAVAAWRGIASQSPSQEHTRKLAVSIIRSAHLQTEIGETEEAMQSLDEAFGLLDDLPRSPEVLLALATACNNRGVAHRNRGEVAAAGAAFEEAVTWWNVMLQEDAADESILRGLAKSYTNLASMQGELEASDAVSTYKQAVEIQTALVASAPINRLYQGDLARTYNNVGFLLAGKGDLGNAEVSYGNAVLVLQRLVNASPLTFSYRCDLALALNNLGQTQRRLGHTSDAEDSFHRAIQEQHDLVSAQPLNAKLASYLGGMHNNLALLHKGRRRDADAEASFKDAIRWQRSAVELAPGVDRYAELLENHYVNYEQYLRSLRLGEAADRVAQERAALQAARG